VGIEKKNTYPCFNINHHIFSCLPWNGEDLAGFKEPVWCCQGFMLDIQATCWMCHRKEPSDEEKREDGQ